MTVIEACNLSKDFQGEQAVRQLSLCADKGEVLGLVGPNGAGKTTTMLMLVGLLAPDSGEVRLFERGLYTKVAKRGIIEGRDNDQGTTDHIWNE